MTELLYPTNAFLHFHNDLAAVVGYVEGYISIDWKPAPMRSCDLREVYNQALELLQQTGFGRILTDHQLMPPVMATDRDWLIQEWAPRAVTEAGYQRCAIVQSLDPLNRQTVQEIVVQLADVPLVIHHFQERSLGVAWLLSS